MRFHWIPLDFIRFHYRQVRLGQATPRHATARHGTVRALWKYQPGKSLFTRTHSFASHLLISVRYLFVSFFFFLFISFIFLNLLSFLCSFSLPFFRSFVRIASHRNASHRNPTDPNPISQLGSITPPHLRYTHIHISADLVGVWPSNFKAK